MEIVGFILAVLIGLSLGMIGGGGSILTIPVLVYVLGINPLLATSYSLFIVGTTSLWGTIEKYKAKQLNTRIAFVFAVPALLAVYVTRAFLLPAIPETLLQTDALLATKNDFIMVVFGAIMLVAAVLMIKGNKNSSKTESTIETQLNYPVIVAEGVIVGGLTGLVGAGGGFLIIPALVLLAKLPMKVAVGTSLAIITAKSLIGFLGDLQVVEQIDWQFLLAFTVCALIGIVIGNKLSNKVNGKGLKVAFGWFVLVMSIYVIGNQFLKF